MKIVETLRRTEFLASIDSTRLRQMMLLLIILFISRNVFSLFLGPFGIDLLSCKVCILCTTKCYLIMHTYIQISRTIQNLTLNTLHTFTVHDLQHILILWILRLGVGPMHSPAYFEMQNFISDTHLGCFFCYSQGNIYNVQQYQKQHRKNMKRRTKNCCQKITHKTKHPCFVATAKNKK